MVETLQDCYGGVQPCIVIYCSVAGLHAISRSISFLGARCVRDRNVGVIYSKDRFLNGLFVTKVRLQITNDLDEQPFLGIETFVILSNN